MGALLVHVALLVFLIAVGFIVPAPAAEGGMPVVLGEVPEAGGMDAPSLVEVDVMPEEVAPEAPDVTEQEFLTQDVEETVALQPETDAKKKEEEKPEKTEEARKLAEAQAERERREAEEAARRRASALTFARSRSPGNDSA